ncbi:MAG TPA: HD domain-containing phosphohydrolase [Mariprofundaceae bacterium]|nr:HD domain-containing phosphohydrolase [Mariprofundaceae bacterium]
MPKYIDLLRSHHKKTASLEEIEGLVHEEKETEPDTNERPAKAVTAPSAPTSPEADEHRATLSGTYGTWIDTCAHRILDTFRTSATEAPATMRPLFEHTIELIQKLNHSPEDLNILELEIANRIKHIRDLDEELGDLVQKAIMVMLYAIKMGIHLRLNEDEQHALMLAAILHHIGMTQVPVEIRHKPSALNSKERQLIQQAPDKGSAYLRSCGIEDERILAATAQAPERFNGTGPKKLSGNNINRMARIIGLLSMFEALIHLRSYRKRLLPRDAIRDLIGNHKEEFDPTILKALIEVISLYPVGTYVQLNTGDIGQVVMVHPHLPLRPKVHLTMDKQGNGITPRDVDLRVQPNIMVSRCMYEEDLAQFQEQNAA